MLKTQSKDRSFIADAGLKGTGFLFRFLNKLKMLGVFILLQSFHYYPEWPQALVSPELQGFELWYTF